jgi:4-hydroxy-2-oxoheptanedioate aldolase
MDMPRNSFKRRLATRQWQVGLFVGMANACGMEILAGAGFDWLVIDAEHRPTTRPACWRNCKPPPPIRCRCWCGR